jgi:hypothetical protein
VDFVALRGEGAAVVLGDCVRTRRSGIDSRRRRGRVAPGGSTVVVRATPRTPRSLLANGRDSSTTVNGLPTPPPLDDVGEMESETVPNDRVRGIDRRDDDPPRTFGERDSEGEDTDWGIWCDAARRRRRGRSLDVAAVRRPPPPTSSSSLSGDDICFFRRDCDGADDDRRESVIGPSAVKNVGACKMSSRATAVAAGRSWVKRAMSARLTGGRTKVGAKTTARLSAVMRFVSDSWWTRCRSIQRDDRHSSQVAGMAPCIAVKVSMKCASAVAAVTAACPLSPTAARTVLSSSSCSSTGRRGSGRSRTKDFNIDATSSFVQYSAFRSTIPRSALSRTAVQRATSPGTRNKPSVSSAWARRRCATHCWNISGTLAMPSSTSGRPKTRVFFGLKVDRMREVADVAFRGLGVTRRVAEEPLRLRVPDADTDNARDDRGDPSGVVFGVVSAVMPKLKRCPASGVSDTGPAYGDESGVLGGAGVPPP